MNDDLNLLQFITPDGDPEGSAPGSAPDGGTPEGGEGEGGEGGSTPASDPKVAKMLADIMAQNAKLQQQNQDLLARQTHEPEQPGVFAPQLQQQQPQITQLKEYFDHKMLESPGQALIEAIAMGAQLGRQQAETSQMQIARGQADMMLRSFLESKQREDPKLFDRAANEFNGIVERATKERGIDIAKLPPQTLQQALEDTWEQAVGRASLTTYKEHRRTQTPPPYAVGSGGGAGNFTQMRGGADDSLEPRDALESQLVDSMREYIAQGVMTEDDLKATLKAHRAGTI